MDPGIFIFNIPFKSICDAIFGTWKYLFYSYEWWISGSVALRAFYVVYVEYCGLMSYEDFLC